MRREAKKIAGWIGVGLVVVGQLLPWGFGNHPVGQVWDFLFSRVSRPNAEWWIWFFAPVGAALFAVRSLLRDGTVDKIALSPVAIFLVTWTALVLTHSIRYLRFAQLSILATFAGLLLLTIVALMPDR
jgi:hypothetical protein